MSGEPWAVPNATDGDLAGYLGLYTRSAGGSIAERGRITSAGKLGVGTTSPTAFLDVNGDTARVRTAKTPASATATGNQGDICWDASFVYVCVGTNTGSGAPSLLGSRTSRPMVTEALLRCLRAYA